MSLQILKTILRNQKPHTTILIGNFVVTKESQHFLVVDIEHEVEGCKIKLLKLLRLLRSRHETH